LKEIQSRSVMLQRHLLASILVLAWIGSIANADTRWIRVASPTTQHLRDVHFASASNGWIAGEGATVLRSTNGGATWTPVPTSPSHNVSPADCCWSASTRTSPSAAWFAGPKSVLRYASGTHSSTLSYGPVVLSAVYAIPNSGYAWYGGSTLETGGSLRLYRRISSSTLTVIFFTSGRIRGIYFLNENDGWAVGTGGTVVRIANGPASQPSISTGSAPVLSDLNAIVMLNAATGWIVGDFGTILRTTNGSTWTVMFSGTVNRLRDVAFLDANNGVIVGDAGLILVTSDGGATWKPEPSGTFDDLHGVSFAGSTAFAVGRNGTILQRVTPTGRRRSIRH